MDTEVLFTIAFVLFWMYIFTSPPRKNSSKEDGWVQPGDMGT